VALLFRLVACLGKVQIKTEKRKNIASNFFILLKIISFATRNLVDEFPNKTNSDFTTMVKIRLARRGRKKLAIYDIVVADVKAPRDGRFIEKIGTYSPTAQPMALILDEEKAFYWVMVGAQPTDTTRHLLSQQGVMFRRHLQIGVNKGAITQEAADAKLKAWKDAKAAKNQGKGDDLAKKKAEQKKVALAAETKIKEARAEAIKKKNEVPATPAPAPEENTNTEA
jgi:small subunit ribosomal protein S16